MNILLNLNMKKKVERVPIFVLNSTYLDSTQFYGFHEKLLCPIFDDDFRPTSSHDHHVQAVPFTAFGSSPQFCNFVSFNGDILVVGGTLLPLRLISRLDIEGSKKIRQRQGLRRQGLRVRRGQELLSFEEIVEIIMEEEYPLEKLLSLPQSQRGLLDITCSASDRVMAFQVQKFVENEQKPKVELRDLDSHIEHPYWKSYAPLKRPRLECKLFVVDGFVYSIGDVDNDSGDGSLDLSLEVFMGDIWRDLHILGELEWQYSGSALVLAAVGNTILIGSFTSHCSPGSFYALLLIEPEVAKPSRLDIECPIEFLTGCCGLPGIVVDNRAPWDDTIVVWHDTKSNCIRGLHLGHKQHFTINFVEEKILIPDSDDRDNVNNLYYANLIGFGDGTLGMIYTGRERHSFVDDQGVPQYMCDYRCVTFEIIYDYPAHSDRVNYPGILVKTKIISNRKCYAPLYMQLQTTFLMDVCFPDQVENLSLSAIKERGIGLHTILQ